MFQHVTDWVGGLLLVVVIAGLVLLDARLPDSRRARRRLWSALGVLALAALGIIVARFAVLSTG